MPGHDGVHQPESLLKQTAGSPLTCKHSWCWGREQQLVASGASCTNLPASRRKRQGNHQIKRNHKACLRVSPSPPPLDRIDRKPNILYTQSVSCDGDGSLSAVSSASLPAPPWAQPRSQLHIRRGANKLPAHTDLFAPQAAFPRAALIPFPSLPRGTVKAGESAAPLLWGGGRKSCSPHHCKPRCLPRGLFPSQQSPAPCHQGKALLQPLGSSFSTAPGSDTTKRGANI